MLRLCGGSCGACCSRSATRMVFLRARRRRPPFLRLKSQGAALSAVGFEEGADGIHELFRRLLREQRTVRETHQSGRLRIQELHQVAALGPWTRRCTSKHTRQEAPSMTHDGRQRCVGRLQFVEGAAQGLRKKRQRSDSTFFWALFSWARPPILFPRAHSHCFGIRSSQHHHRHVGKAQLAPLLVELRAPDVRPDESPDVARRDRGRQTREAVRLRVPLSDSNKERAMIRTRVRWPHGTCRDRDRGETER